MAGEAVETAREPRSGERVPVSGGQGTATLEGMTHEPTSDKEPGSALDFEGAPAQAYSRCYD